METKITIKNADGEWVELCIDDCTDKDGNLLVCVTIYSESHKEIGEERYVFIKIKELKEAVSKL